MISISSSESRKNLSEATLSRITTIFVNGYDSDEKMIALQMISRNCLDSLAFNDFSSIEHFCSNYYHEFKKELSFQILSKIFSLAEQFHIPMLNTKNSIWDYLFLGFVMVI
jgi:hypothetical protein